MGKQSRRPARRNRNRDWLGREGVAFFVAWYQRPEQRAEAKARTLALVDETKGADVDGLEWLTYDGTDAELFLGQVIREAPTLELVGYYQKVGDLLRQHGGRVLVATVPAAAPGEEERDG